MNIFRDIQTAVKLTGEIRKARKAGAGAVQIRPVYKIPLVSLGHAWPNTVEGCLTWKLGREIDRTMTAIYGDFPPETQRWLELTPDNPGGWVDRAQFWQRELEPVLPAKTYHAVMVLFVNRYAHCLRMEVSV